MKRNIGKGIYLVVDPSMDTTLLLQTIELVLQQGIAALQVWDNFLPQQNIEELLLQITSVCHSRHLPVFINNRWEYLKTIPLDGVHFDTIPADIKRIQKEVGRSFLCGLTCNNDMAPVLWAHEQGFDYISFCSMFPSSTANSCELVTFDTIRLAKQVTNMPIFLAGGIRPENMPLLDGLDYAGIAVVSGIMNAGDPAASLKNYQQKLYKEHENRNH